MKTSQRMEAVKADFISRIAGITTRKSFFVKLLFLSFILLTTTKGYAQTISPWKMNRGGGIINYSVSTHGDPAAYSVANIPSTSDANWTDAPVNTNGEINFSETSILPGGSCLTKLDFTYFQTFISIPTGFTVSDLNVSFSAADDGARAYIFNSDHPNGAFIGEIGLGGAGTSTNYASLSKAGEINRLVIVQFDSCPTGNNLTGAKVNINGQAAPINTGGCTQSNFFWSNPPALVNPTASTDPWTAGLSSSTSATGTINGIGYTYESNVPFDLTADVFMVGSRFPASYGIPNQASVRNIRQSENRLVFDQPMTNPILVFSSIGGAVPVSIQFDQDIDVLYQQVFDAGAFVTVDDANDIVTGKEAYVIVRFNGSFSELTFDYLDDEFYVNFAFGADFSTNFPDTVAPTLTLNGSATETVTIGDVFTDAGATITDNCDTNPASLVSGTVDTNVLGTYTLTYTGVDASGNTSNTLTRTVSVVGVAPVITTSDITVSNDAGACGAIVNYAAIQTTVGIPAANIVYSIAPGSSFGVGTVAVTATATNSVGTSSSTFNVTVEDNEAPSVIAQDITVQLDASGNATITPGQIDNGSSDNCEIASIALDRTTFDCSDVGTEQPAEYALQLDGQNDFVNMGDFGGVLNNATQATYQVWVKVLSTNSAYSYSSIIEANNGADKYLSMEMHTYPGGFGKLGVWVSGGALHTINSVINLNEWISLTAVYDGTQAVATDRVKIYVNGVNQALSGGNIPATTLGDIEDVIIGSQRGEIQFSNTIYDEARVWDYALSAAEVQANWNQTIVGNEAGLLGYYSFEDGPGSSTVTELTGNQGLATLNNMDANTAWVGGADGLSTGAEGVEVTLTVTDVNGNVSTETATVTVEDNIAPAITAPADIDLNATSAAGAIVNYAPPVGTDNCAVTTALTAGLANGATFPIGTTVVTYTATDGSGNATSASFDVNVTGIAPDIIVPADITVSNDTGVCGAIVDFTATESTAIPASVITYDIQPNSTFGVGTTVVTATATNAVGTSIKSFNVTVNDTQVPTITSPFDISTEVDPGICGAVVDYEVPTASDNCGTGTPPTTLANHTYKGTLNGHTYFISNTMTTPEVAHANAIAAGGHLVTITDAVENTFVSNFNSGRIWIGHTDRDNEGDWKWISNEPVNYTNWASGEPNNAGDEDWAVINWSGNNPDWNDWTFNALAYYAIEFDGGTLPTTLVSGPAPGDVFPVGTTTVTYEAVDPSGNRVESSFDVTVVDDEAPVITAPANIDVFATSAAGAIVNYATPVGTDNCAATTALTAGFASGATFPIGTTPVTYTATDASGNVASATFNVTVTGIAPVITAADISVSTDEGVCGAIVTYSATETTVGIPAAVITYDIVPGSNFGVGTTSVTATATNAVGSSTTTFNVIVTDNEVAEVITTDITVELDASGNASITTADIDNGSNDACGIAGYSLDIATFDCTNVGANTVTLIVTDNNGNVSSNTAIVTVVDVIAPTVITKNITVALDGNGIATITPAAVNDGTFDNCSFTLSLDNNSFDCNTLGENTVMLTATDASNNSTTLAAIVTVVDNAAPTIVTNPITVELDENGLASIVASQVDGGTYDNCAVASVTIDMDSFTCDNLGGNIVTITATDVNGNVSSAPVVVSVIDVIAPTVGVQNISVDLDENGVASISPEDVLIFSEEDILRDTECDLTSSTSKYVMKVKGDKDNSKGKGHDNGKGKGHNYGDDDDDNDPGKGKGKGHKKDDDDDDDDNGGYAKYVFDGTGKVLKRLDGSLSVTGVLVNEKDAADSYNLSIELIGAYDYTTWRAMGRKAKEVKYEIYHLDWTFYTMSTGTLTGTGSNVGTTVSLKDYSSKEGFQLGNWANGENGLEGLRGKFKGLSDDDFKGELALDVSNCEMLPVPAGTVYTSDNCTIVDFSLDRDTFSCTDLTETTVNLTATDQSGNTTTVPVTVTVNDRIAPVAIAQNITVSLGANGSVTVDPILLGYESTDNTDCALTFTLDRDTFDCDDIGKGNYYYDDHSCDDDRHKHKKGKGHNYGDDDDDNDPGKGKGYGHKKGSKKKGHKVTLTVTDAAGNSSSATAYITVVDEIAPVISDEAITLVVYGKKKAYLTKKDVELAVTDNCKVKYISFARTKYSRNDAGMNSVMVKATDYSGNQTTGAVNVNVVDISSYGKYVTMCYEGRARRVKYNQVQNYLRKGAVLGSCSSGLSEVAGQEGEEIEILEDLPSFTSELKLSNYPNPTAGYTVFTFSSNVDGPAKLVVMSTTGVQLATLFNDELVADEEVEVGYEAGALPSGIYIVRLVTGGTIKNVKLMVRK